MITPAGLITEFTGMTVGAGPSGITAGPDGNLWFTELNGDRIGRITPAGLITEFTGMTAGAGPTGITAGPDGNLWFTERFGNKIGQITPTGLIAEFSYRLPFGAQPYGITAGPDRNLWFATAAGFIGRITPLGLIGMVPGGITAGQYLLT